MDTKKFSTELESLRERNLFREIKVFESSDGRSAMIDGLSRLIFCSNDYLGLSRHPDVLDAVREGLEKFGAGSGASRLVSGSMSPHRLLEESLADFIGVEAMLLFGSGYLANIGIIPALAGKGDRIFADRLNHASLVDGCLLSRADFKRYPHSDMDALEKMLKNSRVTGRRWIVTDGLFSMDGDLAPLDRIVELAEKYDAGIYLDDAHAFGILGENGRGTPEHFGVEGKIDIYIGTLGKAAGLCGAFAGGSRSLINYLTNKARTLIFSTSLPPALALGGEKAVGLLKNSPEIRRSFLEDVGEFHRELGCLGFDVKTKSYIIPLLTGSAGLALEAEKIFWEERVYIQAIRPPTVPEGGSRLRLTLSANQKIEDRKKVLLIIEKHSVLFKSDVETGRLKEKRF
jgi:glycine C-acetyltransferase